MILDSETEGNMQKKTSETNCSEIPRSDQKFLRPKIFKVSYAPPYSAVSAFWHDHLPSPCQIIFSQTEY